MFDWYLGEAGFSEQLQFYNQAFWQMVGQVLFWSSVVIFLVLMFVAVVVMLSRQPEAHERPASATRSGHVRRRKAA